MALVLVARDTNKRTDVLVRDRGAGTTTRVSVCGDKAQANGDGGSGEFVGNRGPNTIVTPDHDSVRTVRSECLDWLLILNRPLVGKPMGNEPDHLQPSTSQRPPHALDELLQLVRDDPRRNGHRHPLSLTTDTDGLRRLGLGPYLEE